MKIRTILTFLLIISLSACSKLNHLLDIPIEMRDGINLYTDIYIPKGEGPFPVILSRVPYGTKSDYILQPFYGEYFNERGYVYVSQNVRGKFGSEGIFYGLCRRPRNP